MREEADCSGLVDGEGVRSGMLSSLARMEVSFPKGGKGERLVSQINRAPTEADALFLIEQPPKALTNDIFCTVRDASLCLSVG